MINDKLECFTFENKLLRGEYISLETSIQTILKQHPYPEPMKKLLAESLAIVSLMSAMIKLEGRITLHFKGKGKLNLLVAQCNSKHEIRGLIKYEEESSKKLSYHDLLTTLQNGILSVMLEFDAKPGSPYQGIVQWTGSSITDAIEAYFENSEQLLTRIWLHYDETKETIVGCMLQALPNPNTDDIVNLDFFQAAHQLQTAWLQESNVYNVQAFLQTACPHDDLRLYEPMMMTFKCTCGRAHSEQAIKLLGIHEAKDEIEKNGNIIVTCEFCTQQYSFDAVDIAALFKNPLSDSSSDTLH